MATWYGLLVKLAPGHYFGDSLTQRWTTGVCLTLCQYEANTRLPMHTHSNPGFFLLISGDHLEINPRRERLQPTSSMIYHEEDCPHENVIGPRGMVGLNISLDRNWLKGLEINSGRERDGWSLEKPVAKRTALSVLAQLALGDHQYIENAGLELLELMFGCQGALDPRPPKWLKDVRSRIEHGFQGELLLTQMAREVGVHPVYLARAFRKSYSCTFTEYVNQVRLFEALSRIYQGMTIGDAAAECGFCDQAYLARVAKSRLGVSPSRINWFRSSKALG